MTEPLFPSLADPDGREAIRIGNATLTYKQLAGAATVTAHELHAAGRVAVWAEPSLELAIAVVGALAAGVAVVPINPGLGPRELGHIVDDSAPDMLIAPAGIDPPPGLLTEVGAVVGDGARKPDTTDASGLGSVSPDAVTNV